MALMAKAALSKDTLDGYPWGVAIAVLEDPTADLLGRMWALGYSQATKVSISADAFSLANPRAAGYAHERAAWLVTRVDATSRERIAELVAETLLNPGATEADLASAILSEFDDMTAYRAGLIARTELAEAMGRGSAAGWRDAGVEAVWISDGDFFDEPCRAADGALWSLAFYETNISEHPDCSRAASPAAPGTYDAADVLDA